MIYTEEDSERNSELKKNLRMPPLNFDKETFAEINKHLSGDSLDELMKVFSKKLKEDFQTVNDEVNHLSKELIKSDPRHDQVRDSLIHPPICEGCG